VKYRKILQHASGRTKGSNLVTGAVCRSVPPGLVGKAFLSYSVSQSHTVLSSMVSLELAGL